MKPTFPALALLLSLAACASEPIMLPGDPVDACRRGIPEACALLRMGAGAQMPPPPTFRPVRVATSPVNTGPRSVLCSPEFGGRTRCTAQ